MKKFGIDTSRWQGDFDFAAAKQNEAIEFAILKIGGGDDGLYKDIQFENSYKKCVSSGLDKGVYFFGHAMNMSDAAKEADYLIGLLKDKQFEYPVFYDVEADMLSIDKRTLTDICTYVLDKLEKSGYWAGIYTSQYHFDNNVYDEELKKYSHWVARYSSTSVDLKSKADIQMWQFGGETNYLRSNKINGQTVDQNYCYIDYPSLIKSSGLNGFNKNEAPSEVSTPSPSDTTVNQTYAAGTKISLSNAALYGNASTSSVANRISGVYYIWSNEVENGRIRITNTSQRVGVAAQVTGFINVSDILVSDTATSSVESVPTSSKTLTVGTKIKIIQGAKDLNSNKTFASFVYNTVYVVREIKGSRIVFAPSTTGAITGVVDSANVSAQ